MKETRGSTTTSATIGVLLFVGLMFALVYFSGWFQRTTADFRGGTEAIEDTIGDGDYRIAAYESFYDMCASIQAKEAMIAAQQGELERDISVDRRDQVSTNLSALEASRAGLIAEYNADARKEDTQANFLASDLPFYIDPNNPTTTCTSQDES